MFFSKYFGNLPVSIIPPMLHIFIPVTYQEHHKAQHMTASWKFLHTHTHMHTQMSLHQKQLSKFFLQSVFNIYKYFMEKCDTGFQCTVKFGTGHLHIILLSICEFHEHKQGKGCTFLLT
jgi:hypothetical protein